MIYWKPDSPCPECGGKMIYDGHGHNYSSYKCEKCFHTEEY